ncbi:MAG: hypothetical protein IPQ26_09645 [Elusimicrobia bacterium]|nr:hypothetical protein [Elusimicrobiota bacterium]
MNDVIKNIGNPISALRGVKQSGFGRYHGPKALKAFRGGLAVMVNKAAAHGAQLVPPTAGAFTR